MASNYGGYMGRILLIDLTKETATEYPWTDAHREETLGGKILANRILLDHLTGEEDPFSEENWLIVSTGPLTGIGAPPLSVSKSPRCPPKQERWSLPTAEAASACILKKQVLMPSFSKADAQITAGLRSGIEMCISMMHPHSGD